MIDKFSAERLALTMNFVHLIWAADVTTVDMFTGKLFICRVIQASLDGGHEFDPLRASIISAASSIADNKFADAQQARLEAQILSAAQSPEDLSLACALGLYILRSGEISNDTLLLTTWDYLRNTFSGILTGKYLSEARPLALVVSSVVCHALSKLATHNALLERFISSSPWTLNLANALEVLLKGKGEPNTDEYITALRIELERSGVVLLSRISGDTRRDHEQAAPRIQLLARKVAAKGTFPQHLSSPLKDSAAAYKWDIDSYRRAKRRKKAASAGSDGLRNRPFGFPQNTTFAVSSNDFGLPLGKSRNRERSRRSTMVASTSLTNDPDTQSYDGMRRLRSHAFWELQQSVAENGEGLVRRMQEQEHQRSREHTPQYPSQSDVPVDEDDEIQIYAGEPSDWFTSRPSGSSSPSQDVIMDTDYSPSPGSSGVSSAPLRVRLDPDSPSPLTSLPPSPMSEAIPDSIGLPEASLVLPQSAPANTLCYESLGAEKAIDSLAFELASGAGGINDYAALRQDDFDDVEICDAGELWS
ncbi:hypothetical protein EST38_g1069 [Candolleomyces aberdarensis]|uniref:Uncharacterized protein n=1 Tax=Candolleomyces aberdarensis TaxID=2316362 RepID=A0A4Q2DZ26_9AGAR|nr:hypothetical protein EST38_g1069 [Candolleomyces aberdarensis]